MAKKESDKRKLSPDTEAIVKRLTEEGLLVRNKGKNSIKEIKIDLGKFADAFTAIKISSEQTAKVLTDSWQGNEALLRNIDESLVGMTDQEKDAEKARRDQAKRDSIEDKENKSESLFGFRVMEKNLKLGFKGIKDGLASIRKDPWGSLLSIGKWAIILPVLAGAIKGLLDKIFGDSEMANFYNDINNSPFMKFIKEHPWASLGLGLAALAAVNWGKMYLAMMAAAAALGVRGVRGGGTTIIPGAGGGGAEDILEDAEDLLDDDDDRRERRRRGTLKQRLKGFLRGAKGPVLAMVAINGISYLMSDDDEPIDITSDIKRINTAADSEDKAVTEELITKFENERAGFGAILTDVLLGAGGGAFGGGLHGAIFGGIMGLVTGVGKVAYDAIDDYNNDIDKIPNELESMLKEEQNRMRDKSGRESRFNLSESDKKKLKEANDTQIQKIIDGLTSSSLDIDNNIKTMEASLAGEVTSKRRGTSRVFDDFVMIDGVSVRKSKVIEDLEDAKKERLLREQQLITSRKILAVRNNEVKAAEVSLDKTNKLNDQVEEVAAKVSDARPDISPSVEDRDRKQTVAAGGFALNITNNYFSKGGDTMVQNTSDNRVSSQNSTNAVVFGGAGGRFGGGGVALANGGMA
jgi:hypothetical protein